MVFARETCDRLTSLVKKLEELTGDGTGRGLQTYLIFCGDGPEFGTRAKEFVSKHNLRAVAVSLTGAKAPAGYKVPADAEVTLVFFVKQVAKAAACYTRDEMQASDIENFVDAIASATDRPYPLGTYAPVYAPKQVIKAGEFGASKAARGPNPAVLIFARDVSAPLTSMVQQLEGVAENKKARLDNFVVLVGPPAHAETTLQELAAKHKLVSTTLSTEPLERVKAFHVSRHSDITVMVCTSGVCRAFYTFRASAFDQKTFARMLAELEQLIQQRIAKGL